MRIPATFLIVGLKHHTNADFSGTFEGYTKAEPNNPHDTNAIAVHEQSGKKIGYIARERTAYVREWGKGKTDFNGKISIQGYGSYRDAYITLVEEYESNPKHPLYNKYVCVEIPSGSYVLDKTDIKSLINSYGGKAQSVISKKTDYVVYVKDLSGKALDVRDNPDYHFQVIHFSELTKMLPSHKNNPLWGKEIAVFNRTRVTILSCIVEKGAYPSPTYRKTKTDILLLDDNKIPRNLTEKKGVDDGKRIISADELLTLNGCPNGDIANKEANTIYISAQVISNTSRTNEPQRESNGFKAQNRKKMTPEAKLALIAIVFLIAIIIVFLKIA